jgi:predicted amidohydrolase YtcJ
MSGIDKDFQIEDGGPGYIERDPQTGEPTGILRSCTRLVKATSSDRSVTAQQRREQLRRLLADYNSVGLTSIADRNTSPGALELYAQLKDRGELTCRVYCYHSLDPAQPQEELEARFAELAGHPLHQYDNRLWLRGIKVFLDGGMLTGSARMRQPWGVSDIYGISDPEYRGLLFIEPERLVQIVRLAVQHDFQMTAHSVGDGAVHTLIDAYAAIDREQPIRDKRLCITHCNFMSSQAIDRMKTLGIVADMQPAWLYLDGKTLLRQFGEQRLRYFQPYQTLFREGVAVGGGSDHMQKIGSLRSVNPYNPFLGMWITLVRRPRGMSEPLWAEECLSRQQAIQLYTINNAFLTFEEQQKGSLQAGKLADFIVIDRDILNCEVDEVKEISVLQTYLGGELVFSRS